MVPLVHTGPGRASLQFSHPGMRRLQLAWLARVSFPSGGVASSSSLRPFLHTVSPSASSPFPQLGGGEWAGGRLSRLRSLMISCPHHSFLSHAGGEKEAGGEQERQVQLGTGIVQLVAGAQAPALAPGLTPFRSQR